jgi:hypothetical protein
MTIHWVSVLSLMLPSNNNYISWQAERLKKWARFWMAGQGRGHHRELTGPARGPGKTR